MSSSFHLLLGSDALRRAQTKLAQTADEIDTWEDITGSTDFGQVNNTTR